MNANRCVFCDRIQFEERIVGESKNFWIIATFGQISDGGYVLIVPKRHIPCIGAMELSEFAEMENIQMIARDAIEQEYGRSPHIIFEHGIVGQTIQHAHLHVIPERVPISSRIYADFSGCFHQAIHSWHELKDVYAEKQMPYLLWKDYQTPMTVCWNPPAPLQYLRTVTAEAAGRPERANWRTMDPELDRQLWQGTVARLKPYFFRNL